MSLIKESVRSDADYSAPVAGVSKLYGTRARGGGRRTHLTSSDRRVQAEFESRIERSHKILRGRVLVLRTHIMGHPPYGLLNEAENQRRDLQGCTSYQRFLSPWHHFFHVTAKKAFRSLRCTCLRPWTSVAFD